MTTGKPRMLAIASRVNPAAFSPAQPSPPRASPLGVASRHASVDALRGWVIALMIFVNDVAGVVRAPTWLKHVDANADGMTLPDVVFPAFLFIAGMSIPLALDRAIAQGETLRALLAKIAGRTCALLVMGVLMVNMDAHNPWPRGAWGVLAFAAMLFAFSVVPHSTERQRPPFWRLARLIGALALVTLALSYRDATGRHLLLGPLFDPSDGIWLRHSWWGILGLIGWVYLIAALVYLALGRRREWLVGMIAVLTAVYLAAHSQMADRLAAREWLAGFGAVLAPLQAGIRWLNGHVNIGQVFGSLGAIAVAGCSLGSTLLPRSEITAHRDRMRWCGAFVGGLLIGAVLLDPIHGINKIRATPAWCLLCAAITALAWMLFYWRMEIHGRGGWNRIVQPAGANPLLAYLLHPFLYLIAKLVGIPLAFYKAASMPLAVSIGGAALMTLLVVQLTRLIAQTDYRLKV